MTKAETRREALRVRLIDVAEAHITANGVGALRARDIAKEADCSIGTIYNAFADLDALILNVSYRTLRGIDAAMDESLEGMEEHSAIDRMVVLGRTYCDFALANRNLWSALFEHALPADYPVPEWVQKGQVALFVHIERPLGTYMEGDAPELVARTARSLFSMVHGMVSLSMERRISGVRLDTLRDQTEFMIRTFVKGLEARA